jgi:ABC-type nitrate/sulfonate/bicarbonate transport system substrate-binding protein
LNNQANVSLSALPPPEKSDLCLGYVRLTDSACFILARELGFFKEYGLNVELERQSSWAIARDKLSSGHLDAAHMLAPMILTTTLGLGGIRTPLLTGLSISSNGNTITMANEIASKMNMVHRDFTSLDDAQQAARALAEMVSTRQRLTLATAHPFSTHSMMLRMWLRSGGINPEQDVRVIVLPPEQMVDSLARGMIDGYCVGEPWNTKAVQQGVGTIVATGYQIWNNAPEEVLGVTQHWHFQHPGTHQRLRLALIKAGQWLDKKENRSAAATILSKKEYLDIPETELMPSLTGMMKFSEDQDPVEINCFHLFSLRSTGFPWRSDAEQILKQVELQIGRRLAADQRYALIQECYRPDLYRTSARQLGIQAPDNDYKEMNKHPQPWTTAGGLELGADYCLE